MELGITTRRLRTLVGVCCGVFMETCKHRLKERDREKGMNEGTLRIKSGIERFDELR